jgi:hypothetical protein
VQTQTAAFGRLFFLCARRDVRGAFGRLFFYARGTPREAPSGGCFLCARHAARGAFGRLPYVFTRLSCFDAHRAMRAAHSRIGVAIASERDMGRRACSARRTHIRIRVSAAEQASTRYKAAKVRFGA